MTHSQLGVPKVCGALIIAAAIGACVDSSPTSQSGTPSLARAATEPDPVVTGVDPTSAPQDTTLDLHVFGDHYDSGSGVTLKRGGKATRKIVTNSTTFLNAQELIANITIAVDADTGAYDVEVTSLGGRRGVGTEMFTVRLGPMHTVTLELTDWSGAVWSPAGSILGQFFSVNGSFGLNTSGGKGKKAPPGIELCVDLSHLGGAGIVNQVLYDLFVQQVAKDPTSAGMDSACSVVAMHTRDHSNDEQMSEQTVGTVEHSGGKIVLKDFDTGIGGNGGWEWRIIWDAPGAAAGDTLATDRGEGICISRPNLFTWYVYNDDDVTDDAIPSCAARDIAVDNIAELWRVTGDGFFRVAEFAMPFRFRVSVVGR